MYLIIQRILDLIFPPREGVLMLRGLDYEAFRSQAASSKSCEWAEVILDYHNPFVRKVMWEFKYYAHPKALRFFAESLYENILEEASDNRLFGNKQKAILTPIPASKERKRKYGFNPPELLAKEVKKLGESDFEYQALLKREREVPKQTDIKSKTKRLANVKGIFQVISDKALEDKTVIVIDDVTTTGATLKDAKRALQEAGAKEIKLFAVAH